MADARGNACPGPLLEAKQPIGRVKVGEVLKVLSTEPGTRRVAAIIIRSFGVEYPDPGSYEALARRIGRVYPLRKARSQNNRRLRLTAVCTVCTRTFLNESQLQPPKGGGLKQGTPEGGSRG